MRCILCTIAVLFFVSAASADTTYVSGTIVSQTWNLVGSPYCVTGDILVAGLTIEPGVTVLFEGDYVFEVAGVLNAIGTQQQPICFTTASDVVGGWKGILFQNSQPGSQMLWCIVEKANNSGVRIIESLPSLSHCVFRNNQSGNSGGGLKVSLTTPDTLVIQNCSISNNSTPSNYTVPTSHGGGIWVYANNAKVRFVDCSIDSNTTIVQDGWVVGGGGRVSGNVEFVRCSIKGNLVYGHDDIPGGNSAGSGGGIYIDNGSVTFANSHITDNQAIGSASGGMSGNQGYAYGGGVYVVNGSISFVNSIIARNTASGSHGSWGGGVFANLGQTLITNCTLVLNNIHAIYSSARNVNVLNSIIYFNNNNSTQVTDSVYISYSDVQGGFPGNGNINYNPVILDDSLQIVLGSPCIDAGNPDESFNDVCFPPSLGTVRNDMGAHGGPGARGWLMTETDQAADLLPISYLLAQNYPNPFNPTTTISYQLPMRNHVTLKVFDMLGREIATLVDDINPAGKYTATWNAEKVSSGVYFCRLQAGSYVETKKLLLLR